MFLFTIFIVLFTICLIRHYFELCSTEGLCTMRRPRFGNWARAELLRETGLQSFSLRKLAALAQATDTSHIAPSLFLYAHETGCISRLMSFVYEPGLYDEYESIEHHLGKRSVERLALRGTPMMSLPESYRSVLTSFESAYHKPELIEKKKRELQQAAHRSMLRSGTSPAEVAKQLGLDAGNTHAFLVRGETQRFSLESAERIERFLRA